jgi:hypothetical protein
VPGLRTAEVVAADEEIGPSAILNYGLIGHALECGRLSPPDSRGGRHRLGREADLPSIWDSAEGTLPREFGGLCRRRLA